MDGIGVSREVLRLTQSPGTCVQRVRQKHMATCTI
jgi:hypothetical protein